MNIYKYEHTDTFSGVANYCWVKRGKVARPELIHYGYTGAPDGSYARADKAFLRELVRRVKANLGLTSIRCKREELDDMYVLRPYGSATVVFINYCDEG